MSVIYAVLFDQSGSMDQQFHREYTQRWRVIVSDPTDSDISVLISGYVPLPGASHPNDAAAFALKPEVTTPDDTDPTLRLVTVPYSTKSADPERQNQDRGESPLLRPPVVRWSHVVRQRLFTETIDDYPVKTVSGGEVTGNATIIGDQNNKPHPVCTSAGEPFDPAPEIEDLMLTLFVQRNEAGFTEAYADEFINTVNSDDWRGWEPGTVKLTQFDAERQYEKGVAFWSVTYMFAFADNWDLDLRDVGSYSLSDDANYDKIQPQAANGVGLPRVNLNGAGVALAPTDPPVYLRFRRNRRKDFNDLNLENL